VTPFEPVPSPAEATAARIAEAFAADLVVGAVAWAGSFTAGFGGDGSDIDLYVYADIIPSLTYRAAIAARFSAPDGAVELDNRFWEPGDEWLDAQSGIWIDVMYRTPAWVEDQLTQVLDRHEASTGYTTCFWHNVITSHALFDRSGWFGQIQRDANRPYPDGLRRAIVAKNFPLLGQIHSSYRYQITAAQGRGDLVSVNHRIAAFLASVFDILFAINWVPHPGEKRQVAHAEALCPVRPPDLEELVNRIAGSDVGDQSLPGAIDVLISRVEQLVDAAGLTPETQRCNVLPKVSPRPLPPRP